MARKTDTEILAIAEKVCQMAIAESPGRKADYCSNKSHSPGRYCNASTHTDCQKCRWFSPTKMAMIRVLAERYSDVDSENDTLKKKVERLTEDLKIANETINYYRDEMLSMEEDENEQGANREESAQDTTGEKDVDGETGEEDWGIG